eukprot:6858687-Ditylum_brightwellii.AAC.1
MTVMLVTTRKGPIPLPEGEKDQDRWDFPILQINMPTTWIGVPVMRDTGGIWKGRKTVGYNTKHKGLKVLDHLNAYALEEPKIYCCE